MKHLFSTSLAAAFGLMALVPSTGHAAIVGYYGSCQGDSAAAITAAGHSPVRLAVVDAATLAPLDALMIENCANYPAAAITVAVADGLVLIVNDWSFGNAIRPPGAPGTVIGGDSSTDIDFPIGSPLASGPGGNLTNTSLDQGNSSNHGHSTLASIPPDSTVLATTANPAQVVTFAYEYGLGQVVYSTIPLTCYLTGGNCRTVPASPGMVAYAANLIAWAVGPQFTTCAAEGFTGSKLTLCRQVCEIDQTPTRLTSLIKLYMSAYRSEPPCAL